MISLQRLTQRNIREVYETKDKLTRVKQNFDRIFADYSGKLLKLDGTKPIHELHQTMSSIHCRKLVNPLT